MQQQIECDTHLVGGVYPHDGGGHEPNCASHSVAVLIQLVKGLIALFDQVHAHAVNHIPEGLDVHWELADCVCQGCIQDIVGPALKYAF